MSRPRPHPGRPHPRRRPGQLGAAAALLVLALLGSACSTGGDDAAPTTTEPERSSGGPTTTTTPGTGAPGTPGSPSDPDDPDAPSPVQDGIRIEVVSSQPDRVTGPDARVRLLPARGAGTDDLTLRLGDRDVTDQLTAVDGRLEGVVTGLVEGNNALVASAGGESVTQRIRSWPLSGPMISGPHAPLLACSTEAQGLGPPSDEDCSAATRVTWRYVTTGGAVQPLPDPSARPADLATAEIEGDEVALVIRHEQGVVNRSTYEIASIDPSPGGADNSQADAAWNGRLLYRYGDGCGTTYGQGDAAVEVLDPAYLRQGFAVATASFNTGAVQCNDVVSAETTMMVKERFIEEFGDPEATIGEGTGFGAAQLHLIVQDYPGLLDGGVALDPLPDVVTVANGIADCVLLNRYYRSPAGAGISPDQRAAINGHAVPATCDRWEAGYGTLFDPERGCDPAIAPEAIYAAGANPGGVRCTLQDGSANQLGRDAATGYAGRPLDNVGVQYGLEALNAGTIDLEAFLALNEDLGGLDADGAAGPDRHEADVAAVQAAYETGRVSTGVGDQRKVPIVDVSLYDDPTGAVADHVRAFSLRDRFTYGGPAESVPGFRIWTRDPAVTPAAEAGPEAVAVVDRWLAAVADDTEGGERELVLFRARPEAAVDNCLPAGATDPVVGAEVYDEEGPCRDDFPVHGSTRIAAGAPRADDVLKCELKPVDPDDYEVELTEAQYDQLVRVFPSGVCDWAQAGVGQTTPSMSDRTYEDVITPGELA